MKKFTGQPGEKAAFLFCLSIAAAIGLYLIIDDGFSQEEIQEPDVGHVSYEGASPRPFLRVVK